MKCYFIYPGFLGWVAGDRKGGGVPDHIWHAFKNINVWKWKKKKSQRRHYNLTCSLTTDRSDPVQVMKTNVAPIDHLTVHCLTPVTRNPGMSVCNYTPWILQLVPSTRRQWRIQDFPHDGGVILFWSIRPENCMKTRMHSSRMRTGRSLTVCHSLLLRGVLDLIPLNFPLGCGPGSDPPPFPPWVWAWIWFPSISPLGVGLDLIPLNFPLGCGPWSDPPQFPPWVWALTWSPSISPWVWAWIWSPSISPWVWAWTWSPQFPLGCGPGPDPPQFPPWVWAWIGACWDTSCNACWDTHPPVNRMTDRCKNITLATTSLRPVMKQFGSTGGMLVLYATPLDPPMGIVVHK